MELSTVDLKSGEECEEHARLAWEWALGVGIPSLCLSQGFRTRS